MNLHIFIAIKKSFFLSVISTGISQYYTNLIKKTVQKNLLLLAICKGVKYCSGGP